MSVSLCHEQSVPVVSVEGRLDARSAAEFDQLCATLPAGASHVIVDLRRADYISSVGVGSLIMLEKSLERRHGRAILAGATPFVEKVLAATGVLNQFQRVPQLSDAVELAQAGMSAVSAAAEHNRNGRSYRLVPHAGEPCFLELWGDFAEAPKDLASTLRILGRAEARAPVVTTLGEMGFAFGIGGFGKADLPADAVGAFVSAGGFAGVLPLNEPSAADFVISDRPAEVEFAVSAAAGFCGDPQFKIQIRSSDPAPLRDVLADMVELIGERARRGAGFVMELREPLGILAVGLYSPESNELHAYGLAYGTALTLSPKLDDLAAVVSIDAETAVQSGSISIYLPAKVRLGLDSRLQIHVESGDALEEDWRQMLRSLYKDCSRVILTGLAGGYNAKTFRVAGYDKHGRRLMPTVVKIGRPEMIHREEEAHRAYVERFILNNSTSIMGTASAGPWAAIRYNFVGIAGPDARLNWMLDYYLARPTEDVLALMQRLYTQILKPWYGQPRWEPLDLYADHTPLHLFPDLCEHARRDFGFPPDTPTISCEELGIELPNPFRFLRTEYPKRAGQKRQWYQAISHGDLNLKNVLVDEQENLYVIDFSETRPRNIVSDFARMESILKFQIMPVETADELARMVEFEQGLAAVERLGDVPPNRYRGKNPDVAKAYAVICQLRKYADIVTLFETDMTPYWLALLEWTYSVLSYDEPPLRRKLAAYSAAIICGRIRPGCE